MPTDKVPIRRSKGSYQKTIVADHRSECTVNKTDHNGYYFFEILVDTKVIFHLDVLHASNREDTGLNVYWVAQKHAHFMTKKWLSFNNAHNDKELHELLMSLNKGTKYGDEFLDDGSPNPDYAEYTRENTKYVGKQYFATNPFVDKYDRGGIRQDVLYGNFAYRTNKLGHGIWLEGINYRPDWKSQGAFIIAVDEPQILSLYAEKRTMPEKQVKEQDINETDTDHVCETMIYGDYIDLHFNLHNVFDYTAHLEMYCGSDSMDTSEEDGDPYYRVIELEKFHDDNPSLNYNLKFFEELLVDLRWAERSGHDVGENDEDSLQDYRMVLVITPLEQYNNPNSHKFERKTLKREITFTVNYTENFSLDVHEPEYVEQIAYINRPPLVSQSFESCNYTELKLKIGNEKPVIVLQENSDGSLKDNKTPYYEFVADNQTQLTITAESDVETCENDPSHQRNIFDLNRDNIDRVNSSLFGHINPLVVKGQPTDTKLQLLLSYPYDADGNLDLFTKYIFGGDPMEFWVAAQSCRYRRTLAIKVYPEIEWILKLSVASLKPNVYSYTNMKDSSRTPVHNKRSRTASINSKSKSQEVIFEVKLDAKYKGKTNPIISASYENKIKKILEAIVYIKDTMDNLTGVTKVNKGMANKMVKSIGGKIFKPPFTFQLDFPVISIQGAWNYGYMGNGVVKRQGSITFGFTPLIKGTGKLDLIVAAEFIPVVGQILKAADLVLLVAGVEIYFNLYGFGEISLQGNIDFNKEGHSKIESPTTLGVGIELGIKAEASTKKLTFAAEKTRNEKKLGFELAVKGETSMTVNCSAGHTEKGPFVEFDAGFNGIIAYVTAQAQVWDTAMGPKDSPFKIVEPKSNIYNKRWYFTDKK